MGLTLGCARCHDHKFDPLPQSDYFRLQAFFAPMRQRDDLLALDETQKRHYAEELAQWEAATRELRTEMAALTASKREEMRKHALTKFRAEIQQAVLTPDSTRTPYQRQIALMAEKQLRPTDAAVLAGLPEDKKNRCQALLRQMEARAKHPPAPTTSMAVTDIGREAPPTYLLATGDWRKPRDELQPGFPAILGESTPDTHVFQSLPSTGRRAALARWLTRPDHPLTARVLVNRLWHHHFGKGIVCTPNDFGSQGEPPTHPELLDWLAVDFVRHGWSLKYVHRLMVTSATYCQASLVDRREEGHTRAVQVDRENRLLWHARRQRLEGETMRDAMLALTGELNRRPFGPSGRPKLPEKISSYAWKADTRPEDQLRRSIYLFAKRNLRYPLFDAFDLPDMHNSCACRSRTTTAPQALLLLNGDFSLDRARHWAAQLVQKFGDDDRAVVCRAYHLAWGRAARPEEMLAGLEFIKKQARTAPTDGTTTGSGRAAAIADFCHALLNTNEFLYVD
jgi:hypothetical protein